MIGSTHSRGVRKERIIFIGKPLTFTAQKWTEMAVKADHMEDQDINGNLTELYEGQRSLFGFCFSTVKPYGSYTQQTVMTHVITWVVSSSLIWIIHFWLNTSETTTQSLASSHSSWHMKPFSRFLKCCLARHVVQFTSLLQYHTLSFWFLSHEFSTSNQILYWKNGMGHSDPKCWPANV